MSEEVFMWPTFTGEDGSVREATKGEVVSAVYDLRALLAQRDAELEALRGKISEAEEWLREDEDNCGNCHYAAQMAVAAANDGLASMPAYAPSCDFHEGARRLLSALSDNPESPALIDKEA